MRPDRREVDFGSFRVHKKVFSQIAAEALKNVEGASLAEGGFSSRLAALFNQDDIPGISVDFDDQDNAVITIHICVRSGYDVADLSRMVQSTIRATVERMINVNLKDINVVVVGLERRNNEIP